MKFIKPIIMGLTALIVVSCSNTQNEISEKEYQSAVSFMYANYNNKTAFNLFTTVNWFDDKSGIWFVDYSKDLKSYKTVQFSDNEVKELFDHKKMAEALNKIDAEGRGVVVIIRNTSPTPFTDSMRPQTAGDPMPTRLLDYGVGAQIVADLGLHEIELLSDTPRTVVALEGYDLKIVGQRPIQD